MCRRNTLFQFRTINLSYLFDVMGLRCALRGEVSKVTVGVKKGNWQFDSVFA